MLTLPSESHLCLITSECNIYELFTLCGIHGRQLSVRCGIPTVMHRQYGLENNNIEATLCTKTGIAPRLENTVGELRTQTLAKH